MVSHLRKLRQDVQTAARRLLRFLLLWHRSVPADANQGRVLLTGRKAPALGGAQSKAADGLHHVSG